jgi:hypothetical protein
MEFLSIIITGFLVRADGWGTDDPRWKKVADFLNAWSCAALFALLCAFSAPLLPSAVAGLAFLVWRMPGFNGWENWLNMYWRGWWTSALGFGLLSCVVHGNPCYGILSVPFAAVYMTIYAGGYKWLPQTILGYDHHVWIEHASGWAFRAFILAILWS